MEKLAPSLYIPVSREHCPSGGLTLQFSGIKDFKPERIISNNEYLKSLDDIGQYIAGALDRGSSSTDIAGKIKTDWPQASLIIDMNDVDTSMPKEREKTAVDDILSMVATRLLPAPRLQRDRDAGRLDVMTSFHRYLKPYSTLLTLKHVRQRGAASRFYFARAQ
jgi:hypothetical protein